MILIPQSDTRACRKTEPFAAHRWGVQVLIATFTLLAATSVWAAMEYESIEAIRSQVQHELETHFQQRYPNLVLDDTLTIQTGQLDRRLRLIKCDGSIHFDINELPHSSANVTVKTSCRTSVRWTIYVPATIGTYRDVVIAAHSLAKGSLIASSDLGTKRINTAKLTGGHVENKQRLIGLELKRPIRASEVIKLNLVKQPDLVRKGDTVVLRVKSSVLSVETEGTALSSGHKGEQIRVRNDRSKRIVDGLVMAPGEVQVNSW
ncbi:flagellar basal body P-ring formation chaperone FlgA [Teredinibacter haidensis]|uniref:flagellar basal body P-ring formation chaperone FlgA n=1 Tax=Teredinibacter haidensis TaxID=2731755 RepID=UPI000AB57C2E|nr:flagellar basal body P-ring formation chaperone FlgA [Teredinibacter haidensis]